MVSPLSEREAVAMTFECIIYLLLSVLGTHESSVFGGHGFGEELSTIVQAPIFGCLIFGGPQETKSPHR